MRITGRTAAAIAASLEQQLHAARSGPGQPLPPVRELAGTLRVSPATVAAAYKLLKTRGLTSGDRRRGTRVLSRRPAPAVTSTPVLPAGVIDLATGNPDSSLLPPLEPALATVCLDPALYIDNTADKPLLAFAALEFEADGIPSRAMAVLGGALDAIERILREYVRPGDRVALEDPTFPGLMDLVSASGFVPVPFVIDEDGPVPDALADALGTGCKAVIITPRAQNPTGAAISRERADALRRILRRVPDVVLIENDEASAIAGVPGYTLRGDRDERWAVVRSTSKFLGPDLRVAVMAGDALTVARVRGRQALGTRWVSRILQQLVLALWSDPASGRRLARAGEVYTQRRTALRAALDGHGIAVTGTSGFNVWVPVRDETLVVRTLAERGWGVAPGEQFRIQTPPAIRITTSTLDPGDAGRFAQDLAEALRPSRTAFV